MGNRSTISIVSKDWPTSLDFYGHWSGEDNLAAVKAVLDRTDRIGQPDYLAAQIFFEFSRLGNYDGNLSFGISIFGGRETENPWILVNADTGHFWIMCRKCQDEVNGETWFEELGLCVNCSNKYFDEEQADTL